MARSVGWWSRLIRAADAVSLAYVLVLAVLFATRHASAIDALGVVFAGPIYLAGVVCVVRWIHLALNGRWATPPRSHLGRPSWERRVRPAHELERGRRSLTIRRTAQR